MRIYVAELKDKNGSEAVRKLLGVAYSEMYGGAMPSIVKSDKGKPFFAEKPDVHFSLSHTDNYVMCAIGDSPVGCDVQSIRPVSDRVVHRTCSDRELECFSFFQLWTLKESWIKLCGSLDRELQDVEFVGTEDSVVPSQPVKTAKLFELDGAFAAVCSASDDIPCELKIVSI